MQRIRFMAFHPERPWPRWLTVGLGLFSAACGVVRPTAKPEVAIDGGPDAPAIVRSEEPRPGEPTPRPALPVPVWKDGKVARELDLARPRAPGEIVIDLG